MSEEGARGLGLGNNPAAIFLMCLVIISIQVSPVRGKAYWTYSPQPLLFHLVVWSHSSISVYTDDSLCWGEYLCKYLESWWAISNCWG